MDLETTSAQDELQARTTALASENILTTYGEFNAAIPETDLYLPDGRLVRISTDLLLSAIGAGASANRTAFAVEAEDASTGMESVVIPIVEERLDVGKRTVATRRVLLQKHVHAYDETLDVPLAVRTFDIERVVFNKPVDAAPPVRHEGDTTIYPLVEEQLVLTTQLILKEEVRVTKRDTERRDTRTVTLRRESLSVTHAAAEEA